MLTKTNEGNDFKLPDLHSLFQKYHEEIKLSPGKKENLKRGRDALREKIRKYFKDLKKKVPKFQGQGSYMMGTIVNPLPEDEHAEYDIDDGIYFVEYNDTSEEDWPVTQTLHNWIKDAVDGHTSIPPKDKNTCIRVTYVDKYHVDLPCYIVKDEIAYLAHKKDGWVESDPKKFTEWFKEKNKERSDDQLLRLVRYLKAWKDKKNVDLSGLAVTILTANNLSGYTGRDDKALLATVTNIIDALEIEFSCKKPVFPEDELLADYSATKQTDVINKLKSLQGELDKAIKEEDELKASEILIEEFGTRFPKGKEKSTEKKHINTVAPAIIRNNGRSA